MEKEEIICPGCSGQKPNHNCACCHGRGTVLSHRNLIQEPSVSPVKTAEECYKQCGNTKSSGGDNPICLNCGSSIKDKRREIIKRKFEGLSVKETNLIIECMEEYANQFKKQKTI